MDSKTTKIDVFLSNVQHMSQFRFILFVLSILFCFVVIIVVLFVIPCEWSNCISSREINILWSDSVFNDIGIIYFE